ncbi:MAG: hypothetical protein NZ839_05275, partial [Endomicrobia bacterium]|nr:hypothetical protein [Endomicrobiia bacterium]
QRDIPSQEVVVSTSTYDIIPPSKINDLLVKQVPFKNEVVLNWTAVGDNGMDKPLINGKYEIKFTTVPNQQWDMIKNIIEISTITTPGNIESVLISSLPEGVTIYFMIRVRDDYGNYSEVSNVVSIFIKILKRPKYIAGLKAVQISTTTLLISWSPIRKNNDGSICSDLIGYNIYKSTLNLGNFVFLKFVSSDTLQYIDVEYNNVLSYYIVKGVNSLGNESLAKMCVNSNGDIIFYSDDRNLNITFPYKSTEILYKSTNEFKKDLVLDIEKVSISNFLLTYDLKLIEYDEDVDVGLINLGKPIYLEFNLSNLYYNINKLCIFYWYKSDEYIKLPNFEVILLENKIKLETSCIGRFSIGEDKKIDTSISVKIYPKIFTPLVDEGDFKNIKFYISNPQNKKVVSIKIYDIFGNLIREEITQIYPNLIYSWDGKDINNKISSSGVYIYEVKFEDGKTLNGSIILAK